MALRFNEPLDVQLTMGLESFANDLGRGYLKRSKAVGMLYQLINLPEVLNDRKRLVDFLWSCLHMEGFVESGLEVIADWLVRNAEEVQ